MAEMSATTEETLSVSGMLLSKTFGQQAQRDQAVPGDQQRTWRASRSARRWSAAGSS